MTATLTAPARPRPASRARPSVRFLDDAGDVLVRARSAGSPSECYCLAHLSALRTAAAVLATRARPVRAGGHRPGTAWEVLAHVAPELREWALFFAAGAPKRAAAGAGRRGAVTHREADDLVVEAERFLAAARRLLDPARTSPRPRGGPGPSESLPT